jgi:hypothetical protein
VVELMTWQASWQELMTWQMAQMLWRGTDVARLIMLSTSIFLLP